MRLHRSTTRSSSTPLCGCNCLTKSTRGTSTENVSPREGLGTVPRLIGSCSAFRVCSFRLFVHKLNGPVFVVSSSNTDSPSVTIITTTTTNNQPTNNHHHNNNSQCLFWHVPQPDLLHDPGGNNGPTGHHRRVWIRRFPNSIT